MIKIKILAIIVAILVVIGVGFVAFTSFGNASLTGQATKDFYSFTKAICDKDNFCQDYEVRCKGTEIETVSPISGAVIQHNKEWSDPRTNEQIEKLCN